MFYSSILIGCVQCISLYFSIDLVYRIHKINSEVINISLYLANNLAIALYFLPENYFLKKICPNILALYLLALTNILKFSIFIIDLKNKNNINKDTDKINLF